MTPAASRPRIYLAGPEVFLPDAKAAGLRKQDMCAEFGLEGVYPLDPELGHGDLAKPAQARLISASNEGLMRSCDAVIANLTPFRGVSADAGTVFEVGFMRALGRPVLGYSNTVLPYRQRSETYRMGTPLGFDADAPAIAIEDFDGPENLMITAAIEASGSRLIVTTVPAGEELTSLVAFRACLGDAARLLAIDRKEQAPG